MSIRGANELRTLCEVLREIDDITFQKVGKKSSLFKEVHARLIEAEAMSKKMARALYEYNKKFDTGWWEKNPDYETDLKNRLNKEYLIDKG